MNSTAAYRVRCSCGEDLPVATSAAGRDVACHCGQTVKVPRLSELRRLAGQPAFEVRARDRVRQLLLDGGLPPDPICRITQRPTADMVYVTVVCEVPRATGGFNWWWLIVLGLYSLPLYYLASRDEPQMHGSETVFRLPIPIATECQAQVRNFTAGQLYQLLLTVPLYAQLLSEYPQARVALA